MAGSRLRSFTERIVRAASRRAQLAAAGVLITALQLWKVPQWQTAPWRAFLAPKTVGNVLGRVLVHGTTILFRARDHAAQFHLPRF